MEVLEATKAHDQDRVGAPQVTTSHRLRHDRRRARHADRGREQQVLVQAALVRVRG
jgi:hypothetical protein